MPYGLLPLLSNFLSGWLANLPGLQLFPRVPISSWMTHLSSPAYLLVTQFIIKAIRRCLRQVRKDRDISSSSVQKDYSNAETLSRYHKERGNNQDQTCFYYCRVKSPSSLLSLKTFQTPPIPGASEHRVAALGSKCHDGVGFPATWWFLRHPHSVKSLVSLLGLFQVMDMTPPLCHTISGWINFHKCGC